MATDTRQHRLPRLSRRLLVAWAVSTAAATTAIAQEQGRSSMRFPNVVSAKARARPGGRFDFDVTVSSPYDTPRRYADGFRVVAPDGTVLGERTLWHDHQNEQPFTRDLYGVVVPAGVRVVTIQARDRQHGYGGQSVELQLPQRQP